MRIFSLFVFLILSISLNAQVQITPYIGDVLLNESQNHTEYLSVKNEGTETIELRLEFPAVYGSYYPFSASDSSLRLLPGQMDSFQVNMLSNQNLNFDSWIFLKVDDEYAIPVEMKVSLRYSNSFYNNTFDKREEQLKTSLNNLISGQNSLGYNGARDAMFLNIDNKKNNGQGASQNTLECPYTGREAIGYTNRRDAQDNYSFNTEHTFPQGFFSSNEPMKSDMYHLYPTDASSNSQRGNLPFGMVSNPSWTQGGSKKGNGKFEPRNEHKGACARAMLYFVTRYGDYQNFFPQQEQVLKDWNFSFPPNQQEERRNDDIAVYQSNRNPYIDYPQFADRINSFSTTSSNPNAVSYGFYPKKVAIDTISSDSAYTVYFYNSGESSLQLSNLIFQSRNGNFEVSSDITQIPAKDYAVLSVKALGNGFLKDTIEVITTPGQSPAPSLEFSAYVGAMNTSMAEENNPIQIYFDGENLVLPENSQLVKLIDVNGKVIQGENLKIEALARGLYFAEISTNQSLSYSKLVIY